MGVPVVTTKTVGCPEVVEDGKNGRIVGYTSRELADATVGTLRDMATAHKLAEVGKRVVNEKFSWERMAAAYEKLFTNGVHSDDLVAVKMGNLE